MSTAKYISFLTEHNFFREAIFSKKRTWFEKLFAQKQFSKRETRELIELCILKYFEHHDLDFTEIVALYEKLLPNTFRASTTVTLQQYSTPVPLSYIMSQYIYQDIIEKEHFRVIDTTAGNGSLLVPFLPKAYKDKIHLYANEIDTLRLDILPIILQNYRHSISSVNATNGSFYDSREQSMDAVIINPPFGRIAKKRVEGCWVSKIEHLIVIHSLQLLKDNGRAAIIIGGNTHFNDKGKLPESELYFWNYLNTFYHVEDVINCNGDLYAKSGTNFDVRMILIHGRKATPNFQPYTFDITQENTFDHILYRMKNCTSKKQRVKNSLLHLKQQLQALGSPYIPVAEKIPSIHVEVPDSMELETAGILFKIKKELGMNLSAFVAQKLDYPSIEALAKSFSAEQVDALALILYQIEKKNMGFILGDQTGIGKGRVVAGLIRYGVLHHYKPIFITEKPNLFSDIYRDLSDIGCANYKPFIVNNKEKKTAVMDTDGNIVYDAYESKTQQTIIKKQQVNEDMIFATYSQFNGDYKAKGITDKQAFLLKMSSENIIILDEAHNASGESNTGEFFKEVLHHAQGVLYSSATFAKSYKSLPLFQVKTNMNKLEMKEEEFVEAVKKGGVVMQEVISNALVKEGQMIRRERGYGKCEINYISLTEHEQKHKEIYESVTTVIRDIIRLQNFYVQPIIEKMDKMLYATSGESAEKTKGTENFGIDNVSFVSRVFLLVNQLLFSLKVYDVANRVIMRLSEHKTDSNKKQKSVIVALANTNESILQDENEGNEIDTSFAKKFKENLDSIFKYSISSQFGDKGKAKIEVSELSPEGQALYKSIVEKIKLIRKELHISPIDLLTKIVSDAGYSVGEITGRVKKVEIKNADTGIVRTRTKERVNVMYSKFNNNEIDCLIINQSGSTGASAHAMPNNVVSEKELRQRCMIILQPELNINTELQKRGRIHRTGQKLLPIYDYMSTMVPAEQRLMMMLKRKLSSLDANTSSNKEQNKDMMDTIDFFNKYGDELVKEFLIDNEEIDYLCNNPLNLYEHVELATGDIMHTLKEEMVRSKAPENTAYKVAGRVAILPIAMQEQFYQEITDKYMEYTHYLKKVGLYDLDVEEQNLEAHTKSKEVVIYGNDKGSIFEKSVCKEECEVNILTKPFTGKELNALLEEAYHLKDKNNDLKFASYQEVKEFILKEIKKQIEAEQQLSDEKNTLFFEKQKPKTLEKLKIKEKFDEMDSSSKKQFLENFEHHFLEGVENRKALDKRKISNKLEQIYSKVKLFNIGNFYKNGYWYVFTGYSKIKRHDKVEGLYNFKELTMNFAIASPDRNASFRISNEEMVQEINALFTETQAIEERFFPKKSSNDMEQWDTLCKMYTADKIREKRTIYTGNLLLAYNLIAEDNQKATYNQKAKFIKYTTLQGSVKTGIILPRQSLLDNAEQPKQYAPKMIEINSDTFLEHIQLLPKKIYFSSYALEANGKRNGAIGIKILSDNAYILVVNANTAYKDIYTNNDIIQYVRKEFEKIGDFFRLELSKEQLQQIFKTALANLKLRMKINLADWQVACPEFTDALPIDTAEEDNFDKDAIRKQIEATKKEREQNAPVVPKTSALDLHKAKMKMLKLKLELLNI